MKIIMKRTNSIMKNLIFHEMITNRIVVYFTLLGLLSCHNPIEDNNQMVIINAFLYNVNTGKVDKNMSVFIKDGFITKISRTNSSDFTLKNSIDAQEKLLTPSFIDVHNHLNFVFGDTTEITNPDEFQISKQQITEQYMPYGVTAIRSAGGREPHIPMEQSWMKSNHNPDFIDYYPTGGALVSLDTKFYNHIYVEDTIDVSSKIKEYHNLGIRHIKVYSLIGETELGTAVKTAEALDMNIFGHIESSMVSIEKATKLGLKNFEHAKTLFLEIIRKYEAASIDISSLPPDDQENWRYREYEIFNLIGVNDTLMLDLIDLLKEHNVSITPTLHLYAHPIGLSNPAIKIALRPEDKLNWPKEKLDSAKKGYNVLASLVYNLYKNGITLNTGSDTYEPGKTILSEMLLLNDLGIPMNDVFKIATINSARSIHMEKSYGSIEVGKKANMVLFDKNPLLNPENLLSNKTIIKDGFEWNPRLN